jgi:hypothetical protein
MSERPLTEQMASGHATHVRARAQRLVFATWSGVLWSLATFCLLAPSFGARWSLNRHGPFWPAMSAAMAVAFVVGCLLRAQRQDLPRRDVLRGDVIFAATYPLALVAGVLLAGADNGISSARDRLIWVAIGCCVGGVALLCARHRPNPAPAFQRIAVGWATITVLTFWLYGLGLVCLPLAASYYLASRGRTTAT